jgi:hydrogenase nickel incorporation protein HypA/HybF
MHEFSIACSIVDNVLAFCRTQAPAQVLAVRITIGEFSCVEPEQLSFCYQSITKNTDIADSELEIERVPAGVECPHCDYRGKPKYWNEALSFAAIPTLQCPQCGRQVETRDGDECAIKTIRFCSSRGDEALTST